MPSFSSPETVYYFLALIVPGVVFTYARSQFMTGRMLPGAGAALHYVAITALYYAIAMPFVIWALATPEWGPSRFLGWIALLFVAPAILGGLSGWSAQQEHVYRVLRSWKLTPVHPFPTAWDWRFINCPTHYVLVTLKSGREFGAVCGGSSFLSTDPSERDLYLERTFDIDKETNKWKDRGYSPMLIAAGEISTIEFFETPSKEAEKDDKQNAATTT